MQRTQPRSLRDCVQPNLLFLNCHHPISKASFSGLTLLEYPHCCSIPVSHFHMLQRFPWSGGVQDLSVKELSFAPCFPSPSGYKPLSRRNLPWPSHTKCNQSMDSESSTKHPCRKWISCLLASLEKRWVQLQQGKFTFGEQCQLQVHQQEDFYFSSSPGNFLLARLNKLDSSF